MSLVSKVLRFLNSKPKMTTTTLAEDLFRPPILRPFSGTLDRSLFSKTIPLAAATINSNKDISRLRNGLRNSKEILNVERISPIASHPDATLASQGKKLLLLDPSVKPDEPSTWGAVVKAGIEKDELGVIPYELKVGYDYFNFLDVITSILPEELHGEIPSGFNIAGHVAHLNLREPYYPYKKIIGDIIIDKNSSIRTVINKVDNVGTESAFRTFAYEVLAGPDDLDVEVRENECIFHFDYSKVYWNSKLESEHTRLIQTFQPGEVVCDLMGGIGPFAVPAGKRGVFVWANDMNPESYKYLDEAIQKNKVGQFVRPFNKDGALFIHEAADSVFEASKAGDHAEVQSKTKWRRSDNPGNGRRLPSVEKIPVPPTISHFVMNLPASAYTFVHHYRGLYAGKEELFAPHTDTKLPLVHVHCFALKSDGEVPRLDICERLTKELGTQMVPGDAEIPGEVSIHNVRDVAPAKRMFCATFRIPPAVAFAPRT